MNKKTILIGMGCLAIGILAGIVLEGFRIEKTINSAKESKNGTANNSLLSWGIDKYIGHKAKKINRKNKSEVKK